MLALLVGANLDNAVDEEESTLGKLQVDKDLDAAHVQGRFDFGANTVIAGLRHEAAPLRASGSSLNEGEFEAVEVHQRYSHWRPGCNLGHGFDQQTALRAAWSNAVARPTLKRPRLPSCSTAAKPAVGGFRSPEPQRRALPCPCTAARPQRAM